MTTMNGESAVRLFGETSVATESRKRSASRADCPDRLRSELFLRIFRTRLAKTGMLSGEQLRTLARPDAEAPSKRKATVRKQSPKQSPGEPIDRIGLIPVTDSPKCGAHGIQSEIGPGAGKRQGKSEKAPGTLFPQLRRARVRSGAALKAVTPGKGSVDLERHFNTGESQTAHSRRGTHSPVLKNGRSTTTGGERRAMSRASTASVGTRLDSRRPSSRSVRPSSDVSSRGAAKLIRSHQTPTGRIATQGPPTQQSSSNTTSRANPAEGEGARRLTASGTSFRPMRRATHLSDKSLHSSNSTFQQASVGIRRRVLTNKGHTQPHSRPSNSRQNGYLPAKSNATRRWLPSKASRFWGRSESHHPSFRALGHPQRGGSKTSGLKSSGRIPSLCRELRAKCELVATRPVDEAGLEVESRKSKVESPKSEVQSPKSKVQSPTEPVQSNSPAGVVNTKAALGQVMSQVLRNVAPVDAGLESDAKPPIAQRWQDTFWDVPASARANGASGGFQAVLAAPGALIPQVAAHLRRLFRSGKQEMRIRLNPPELGAMRIRIRVMNNGVKATLMVDQAQAHAVLEDNMSALSRALQEQGLKVDSLSVEVSGGADEFGLSSHGESRGGRRDGRGGPQSGKPWRDVVDETMLPIAAQLSNSRLLDVVA